MNVLQSLFSQKSWSNNELFNALAAIPPGQHEETVHAATRMLNHIYVVDRIFRAHLLGEDHGYKASNTEATPELDQLQFDVAQTDAWFEQYTATVSNEQLLESIAFRFTDGDAGQMTRGEMLLHVVTHGTYHRGNVGQMLKHIAVVPPRDLYTKFLHQRQPERRLALGQQR